MKSYGKKNMYGSEFDQKTKGFTEIKSSNLIVSFKDQTCLQPFNNTIIESFDLENPFVSNDFSTLGPKYQSPSNIGK